MFDMRGFIMKTVLGMVNQYPDWQVREYALNWYSKGKITEEDLMLVEETLMQVTAPVVYDELEADEVGEE